MNYLLRAAIAVSVFAISAGESFAQEIRYFVVQRSGLFEIRNVSTGGRFMTSPTGEQLTVPNYGCLSVRGYTDRVQRGETVVAQVRGTGTSSALVEMEYTPQGGTKRCLYSAYLQLPAVFSQTVSTNTSVDNVFVSASQYGRVVCRRLPIGRR